MLVKVRNLAAGAALATAFTTFAAYAANVAIPDGPPAPACEAKPEYGCFVPPPPEPGTDLPTASVAFSMRPAVDNSFHIVAMQKGWFEDVGITIEPKPNGFKATDENAIPLVVRNQNNLGAMFGPSVLQTLRNNKKLKMIMYTDDFVGNMIWASPNSGLKPVDEYLKQGMSIEAALKATLEPLVSPGKKLATTAALDTRPFIDVAFGLAGLPKPELLLVDDPQNLVLSRSGQVEFSLPVHASTNLTLKNEGWIELVSISDLINNVKGGPDSPVQSIVYTVGIMGNTDFINENPNATLRFVSAVFRTIDAVLADGGKEGGLLSAAYPFINAYSGTNLDEAGTYYVLSTFDPLSPWSSQGKYFTDKEDPRYYNTAAAAFIKTLVDSQALPEDIVPDDGIWAAQIYDTLKWYQTQTDAILAALEKEPLDDSKKALVERAKQYYAWYDFLDAFRLAKAAAQ